jgi:hypothetical protein
MKVRLLVMGFLLVGATSGLNAMEDGGGEDTDTHGPLTIAAHAMFGWSHDSVAQRLATKDFTDEELRKALRVVTHENTILVLSKMGYVPVNMTGWRGGKDKNLVVDLVDVVGSLGVTEDGELWEFDRYDNSERRQGNIGGSKILPCDAWMTIDGTGEGPPKIGGSRLHQKKNWVTREMVNRVHTMLYKAIEIIYRDRGFTNKDEEIIVPFRTRFLMRSGLERVS